MDTYIHSMLKTILEEQQRGIAWISSDYQGAYEPFTPREYHQDWNYAPGNQYGNGERLKSSNMEFGYRSNNVAIPQDQSCTIQQQQPQHQSFNPYRQQQSLLSHQHHYREYQQVQETQPSTGFVTQPQVTNAPDLDIRDMLQQLIRNQENFALDTAKWFDEIHNTIETQTNRILSMESLKTFPVDSDIQGGESCEFSCELSCELQDQAEKHKVEVELDHFTRPTDRVKPSIVQPLEFSNPYIPLSDPNDEICETIVQLLWETVLQEAEEVVQGFDSLFECIVDENPVLSDEALSYLTKSSGEGVGMFGKALADPCEDVIVVECVLDEHLGITSTDPVSIDEPRTILFENIRMKEFRGWFYDEYDPGDTYTHQA